MPSVTIDGLAIHYEHWRGPDTAQKKRVMYVHGTGCHAGVFAQHCVVIARQHEVAAIDLPGHGRSQGRGFRSAIDYAFFVGQLVEQLGWDDCVLAGHSLGGAVVLATAVYFPELLDALLLIDTGARLRVNPKILELARHAAAGRATTVRDSRMGYADTTPQAVIDEVNAMTSGCDPEVIYKDWVADDSFDFMSRLGSIEVPAMALCGAADPLTPLKYHEYFAKHLPNCKLTVIPAAGHWPFVENAECFNVAVQGFLESF